MCMHTYVRVIGRMHMHTQAHTHMETGLAPVSPEACIFPYRE